MVASNALVFQQLRKRLAGAAGFEPANAGTKNRCLTTWRRPSRRIRDVRERAGLYPAKAELKGLSVGDSPVDQVVIVLGELARQLADLEIPRTGRLDRRDL